MTKTEVDRLRVTPELRALVRKLAAQLNISASEVYRRGVLLLAETNGNKKAEE